MTKTVKEIEQIQDIIDFICFKHQTNVDDKLIKLYEIRNKMLYYENELAEKDKEIKDLEKEWEKLVCEKYDLQLTQLFKEDFKVFKSCYGCFNNNFDSEDKCYICHANKVIRLKDNSKYDKLPSKDVK